MANNLYSAADDQQEISLVDEVLLLQKQAFVSEPYLSVQARIDDLLQLKSVILDPSRTISTSLIKRFWLS